MKRILLVLVMGFSFIGLFGQTNQTFRSVDVEEFAAFISNPASVTLLDVRTGEEYAEGHIHETDFNIDVLKESFTEIALKQLPKDKPVALYCRSGNRSKNAANILSSKGYEVIELESGFRGWTAAGKEIDKPKNMNTISATELYQAFVDDNKAAEKKYGMKTMTITGVAVKVGPDVYGLPSVEVAEKEGDTCKALCVLPFTDYLKLRHVKKTDRVEIVGEIRGFAAEYDLVVVKQCKIAVVNGKKQ